MRRLGAIALMFLLAGCSSDHRSYDSEFDFVTTQKEEGWAIIGSFGTGWPAHTEETIDSYATIKFTRDNGTPHIYGTFEGYDLKVIKMRNEEGQEVIRVLRSQQMTGIVGDELRDD